MVVSPTDSLQAPSVEPEKSQLLREGFIDEVLVQKIVMSHVYQCQQTRGEEMVMFSSEDDYAGWNLPVKASFGCAA